ncbi:unnamed protein product [Phytophthora fragariaefolia]|uniref:Unnamed protein product n=1 Tax=Phytophthora fragariaefolia TaxID=1490495 RepID=A0A9W6TZV9_9STRA|nr:unnamed protein product [Phytophthora fragariaefolia]
MTIDTRSVNEKTEPMPWPMPVLDVVIGELEGARFFFVLEWYRGYWQLPLHLDSQELYSFVTHRGIYTPTRVPMGATDAVAYCQGVVEEIFGDLRGHCMLAWFDDILGFAETEEALMDVLDQVLARCEHVSKVWLRCSGPVLLENGSNLSASPTGCGKAFPTYAIVEATIRLEYLLLRSRGFRLYTDHRNLVYIFNPYATDGTMARYQADKFQRWALSLICFQYIIEHVPGDVNVWGDLLSRWGAGQVREDEHEATRVARLAVLERVSPLEDTEFVWPSETEIKAVHNAAREAAQDFVGAQQADKRELMVTPSGQVWIPADAEDLRQRLCGIAHAGASGHQAHRPLSVPSSLYSIGRRLRSTLPRLLGNVYIGGGGVKYVLVLKDGMSGYVELVACLQATADTAYQALIDWFKRFGVVHQWVSDQGEHVRNQIVERLQRTLGAQHHFVTAYTPWANGTVEVVNREILKCMKALLSERRLAIRDWPALLPVVQAAFNSMPADRLGGKALLATFTALPGGTQLTSILYPRDPEEASMHWVAQEIQEHLDSVRVALDGLHAEVVNASEKRRRAARERHARRHGVKLQKFSEGDCGLAATATGRSGNKLALVWRGPKRIVRALNDFTVEVQDIVQPFKLSVRHASRQQLYRDARRGQVDELQEQAIYGEGGHLVEALRECRLSPDSHCYEIFVKWYGLGDVESSWEPADSIKQDAPPSFSNHSSTLRPTIRGALIWRQRLPAPPPAQLMCQDCRAAGQLDVANINALRLTKSLHSGGEMICRDPPPDCSSTVVQPEER